MLRCILLILSFVLHSGCAKADEYIEYNQWYSKDGVLYDITNTKDGDPVMLSIYAPGKKNANMVVSYYSQGKCEKNISTLKIDANDFPAQYLCIPDGNGKINHFTVTDADSVNYMIDRLTSGLTIVLQDDIKVWRGNFDNPRFGITPNFW